jgi:hypothetical protein
MKPDLYTKLTLTVIAITLAVIACKQFVNPTNVVNAQSSPRPLLFAVGPNSIFYVYETPNGFVSSYAPDGTFKQRFKLGY